MDGNYPTGVIVPKQAMGEINKRLIRSEKLPSYDILIMPKRPRGGRLQPASRPKGKNMAADVNLVVEHILIAELVRLSLFSANLAVELAV